MNTLNSEHISKHMNTLNTYVNQGFEAGLFWASPAPGIFYPAPAPGRREHDFGIFEN